MRLTTISSPTTNTKSYDEPTEDNHDENTDDNVECKHGVV